VTPARAIGTAVKRAFLLRGSDGPEGALFPLPSQLSMFADESARPDGLHYQPDFISAQEEAALIGHIRALPLAPFQFGIYEGKRRVVFFGSRYDFTHQWLEAVEELPAWLVPLAGRASASRPSGQWKDDDFDVLADGVVVGRIMKARHRRRECRGCGRWPLSITKIELRHMAVLRLARRQMTALSKS